MVRSRGICATKQHSHGELGEAGSSGKSKGGRKILPGDLNARLGEPRNKCKKELSAALSDHGLEEVTMHFTPMRGFRRRGKCIWQM